MGLQKELFLGNLDSQRDWGHAKDYVEGMWRMLQQDEPDDFVLATGIKISVREFISMAFLEVGINLKWQGSGENEKGVDPSGKVIVEIDPKYYRPAEVDLLLGDESKAKNKFIIILTLKISFLVQGSNFYQVIQNSKGKNIILSTTSFIPSQ